MARIIIIEGPHKGREYGLGDSVVIGRSLDADIRLPDVTVSRHHARIKKTDRGFFVEDLGSGNGTRVNDRLINKPTLLRDKDTILISDYTLCYSVGELQEQDMTDIVPVTRVVTSDRPETTILSTMPAEGHTIAETEVSKATSTQIRNRLKTVINISNSMQSILELRELLPRIVDGLLSIFPRAQHCLIMLKDESGRLVAKAARARGGGKPSKVVVSKTIVQEVTRNRMSVLSADAMSDKRFGKAQSVLNMEVRSVMCVPLIFQEELLGIIYIDSGRPGDQFSFRTEDLDLLTGVASQAAMAIQNARMHQKLLMRQRLERDMQFAHEVQKSFLPDQVPMIKGYEFSAWYGSAHEVGGDFYDFIQLPKDKVAVVIGDVSGKGVPAALLMARLTSEVRSLTLGEPSPSRILNKLNSHIISGRAEDRFVTLIYIILDIQQRAVEVANAGHPYPVVRKGEEGSIERLDVAVNPPLGVLPNVRFQTHAYSLGEGDTIAVYTDGVTEAMNIQQERFGMERLEQAMARGSSGARTVMERILADISDFVGLASPSDDLTLVCFSHQPAE